MNAVFSLIKKVVVSVSLAILCFSLFVSLLYFRSERMGEEKTVYFVVYTGKNVRSCSTFSFLDGGAGIAFPESDGAVFAVYTDKSKADDDGEYLKKRGVSINVLPVYFNERVYKTRLEKQSAKSTENSLKNLYQSLSLLCESVKDVYGKDFSCFGSTVEIVKNVLKAEKKTAERNGFSLEPYDESLRALSVKEVGAREIRVAQTYVCMSIKEICDKYNL